MPKAQLSSNPQIVSHELWYYEERGGIGIVTNPAPGEYTRPKIPWRMLEATMKRYRASKRKPKVKGSSSAK